jgi:hypothetical protein
MSAPGPIKMLCIYRIKKGQESEFLRLLDKHWPTLNHVGLVTTEPAQVLRGADKAGNTFFIEQFAWKDASSPVVAHQTPEVMMVWEPMGALTDSMDFIHVQPVPMSFSNG